MPRVEVSQADIKVTILGSALSGKTCLVRRFVEGYFMDDINSSSLKSLKTHNNSNNNRQRSTATFQTKQILLTNLNITCKLQIWDVSSSQNHRNICNLYYQSADAVILVVDVTQPLRSLECVRDWLEEISRVRESCQNNSNNNKANAAVMILLVASKCDKKCGGAVTMISETDLVSLADEFNAHFVKTSAKENEGVDELFELVAEKYLQSKYGLIAAAAVPSPSAAAGEVVVSTATPLPKVIENQHIIYTGSPSGGGGSPSLSGTHNKALSPSLLSENNISSPATSNLLQKSSSLDNIQTTSNNKSTVDSVNKDNVVDIGCNVSFCGTHPNAATNACTIS